ncbi:MAG: phage minor head protein [Treponema sp.]|nr:phage minor head protein [Treponema sp.]
MEMPYRYKITESLLKRIREKLKDIAKKPEILNDLTFILPPDYDSMNAIHEMFTRSSLMGMEAVLKSCQNVKNNFADIPLLPEIPVSTLPFEEAVSFLRTQIPLTRKEYYDLDNKLRLRSFTVGRLNDVDAINQMKEIFQRNMEQGGSLGGFLKITDDEILNGIGFGKGNGAYWETVYRTNQTTIYNAGRAMAFEETPPIALEFIGIIDSRQTDICHALSNPPFIRPYGDPVWRDGNHFPPLHFGCRSTVRGIYDQSEIDDAGGPDKFYSKKDRDLKPQKGFGSHPLDRESFWRLTPAMIKRAKDYGIDGEIAAAAIKLGMPAYAHKIVKGGFETLYPIKGTPLAQLPSGGYVRRAKDAKPGIRNEWDIRGNLIQTDEIGLAKKAADEGHRVFFMPKTFISKSPDVIIDGHTAEIKHVFKVGKRTIERRIEESREQFATLVLLEVSPAYTHEEITRQVSNRLRNSEHLQTVLVSWGNKFLRYTK